MVVNDDSGYGTQLASCLIYARALLEYVIFIVWVRSVTVREVGGE